VIIGKVFDGRELLEASHLVKSAINSLSTKYIPKAIMLENLITWPPY
jgi:hypothetical protein